MKKRYASAWAGLLVVSFLAPSAWSASAGDILKATGTGGGLVVHVGCGDGTLTAALAPNDRYLVQGLDTDPANVAKAREHIRSLGVYGKVSAERFDGKRLPYVDGLVNLVVAEDPGSLPMAEVLRVLAPRGVAYIREGGAWKKTVKPRPADIDEWTHFLHDAGGNAVAEDKRVGPPKRLHWVAGPTWCRSHEFPSSVEGVVASGGRVVTIFDEGPTGVYKKLPQKVSLIARDAASGVLLWKVPLQQWQPEFGTGTGNRWNIHHTIPRRLVIDGDRVYVTLRFLDSPVSVLDAATGEILTQALPGTKGADETLVSDGVLIAKTTKKRSVGATARFGKSALDDTLAAVDVKTGKLLWRHEGVRVVPYALSAQGGKVVYHNMDALICLDARTGREAWRSPSVMTSTVGGGSTLVIKDGVVLFHGNAQPPAPAGKAAKAAPEKKPAGKARRRRGASAAGLHLTALSLADGKMLWQRPGKRGQAGACTQPTDLFVLKGDVVWCGSSLEGVDLRTGEVRKRLEIGKTVSPGHHYRCFRGKATERYLIWPKRGAEFLDTLGDNHMRNDWLRAPCFTGLTPANGLLYVPTSQCFCYPGVLVTGFQAMSAEPADTLKPTSDAAGLQRGEAFGQAAGAGKPSADDWPMYRRDTQRSGCAKTALPAELGKRWEVALACRGTQPVIVAGRLWVAEKDAHRLRCLRAADGKDVWSYTAGGRIDSAPTVSDGRVLFGCRDGWVYCLRAADGELAWRFRAAPEEKMLTSYEQIESVWPVHGSVLVQDGVAYFAAGRSSYLDGGIIVYGLDVKTGQVRHHHCLEGPWPDITKDTGTPFAMEGSRNDLLVSDGKDLYMQRVKFDASLKRLPVKQESSLGELDMGANHLVATGGFLDDTGFDRLYWMYSRRWPGFYFSQHSPKSGQLVVFDESTTYAVKYFYRRIMWSPAFFPAEHGYLLFADDNDNQPALIERGQKTAVVNWLPKEAATDKYRRGGRGVEKGTGYVRLKPTKWQEMIPLRIRAMVLAPAAGGQGGKLLFAAGTPDVLKPKDPLAAFEGRAGARLDVFSAKDGARVKSLPLPALPAFDGLSAAGGKLYLATQDGKVLCFGQAAGK